MRKYLIVSIAFTLFSSIAFAELASSKLSDLIAESDLIVQVLITKAESKPRAGGYALSKIEKVFKGNYSESELKNFSSEMHEQMIERSGDEYLLFLKNREGQYTGTHYGQSYWPLYPTEDGKLATPRWYPFGSP